MLFEYQRDVDLTKIPVTPVPAFRETIIRNVQDGWRILALFGLPENGGIGLCCILANDTEKEFAVLRCPPVERYPSLTPDCPQAQLFEREIYEQWRIEPLGHPWLKPVRFVPPLAEKEGASRPGPSEMDFYSVQGSQVHEVAVGPVHAGIIEPGHFRFQCHGENVMFLEISLGFQHRGIERLLRRGPDQRTIHFMECAAGDTTIGHVTAYATLLEKMTQRSVSRRAQAARQIALELERLANHTGDLGAIAGDTGFLPTSAWNGRIRGDFLNITALFCGNRFGRGLVVPGGIGHGFEPERCARAREALDTTYRDVRGAVDVMLATPSVNARLMRTGAVSRKTALKLGLVGLAARACGISTDARVHFPLSEHATRPAAPRTGKNGDVMARTRVRSMELDDSAAIIRENLAFLREHPGSDEPVQLPALPANRLAVGLVEGWRGEVCHVAVTGASGSFLTYKIIDPSFHNWSGLAMALRNEQISDFPLCNKSFNLSYCGHDL